MSKEQKKPSQVDAAIAAAATVRQAAAVHHPGIARHVGMPGTQQNDVPGQGEPFPTDEDDKPVYSVRQMERAMASKPGAASLQTSSMEALMREVQRRKDLATGKLKDIPTDWLECELERRRQELMEKAT